MSLRDPCSPLATELASHICKEPSFSLQQWTQYVPGSIELWNHLKGTAQELFIVRPEDDPHSVRRAVIGEIDVRAGAC